MHWRHARGALLLSLLAATAGTAQTPPSPDTTPRDTLIPDSRLFVRADAWMLAGFTAATIALFPLDRRFAADIRSDRLVNNRTLARVEDVLDFVGGPGPLLIGGAMYVVGRVAKAPRAAHLAVHTTEAVLVGIATAGTLKMLLGRARPYATGGRDPASFAFARGLRGDPWQSFPSGHATVSFAVAAAVTSETGEWWPGSTWIVAPVLYGGAGLVGVSRMYDDKHWASDVMLGAAIGTFAGLKTVRFNHTRTGNRVDRWLLGGQAAGASLSLTPAPGGAWRAGVSVPW